ncbi:hypothetical protein K440DRAFT_646215 [Wilcoxina mikolae CBS 423.85]|nr:hypothetical protein K440DRAFT_646215 [Wilcoxina mikolae CBS 423.85]
MAETGFLTDDQSINLELWFGNVHETFGVPGAERTQLDIGLRPATSRRPSIIVQSCVEEEYKSTRLEMKQWLEAGAGKGMVQKVILLRWAERPGGGNAVDCELEVFSTEVYGNKPCREYKATVFPSTGGVEEFDVTLEEVFGETTPSGGKSHWFSIPLLRKWAGEVIKDDDARHKDPADTSIDTPEKDTAPMPEDVNLDDAAVKPITKKHCRDLFKNHFTNERPGLHRFYRGGPTDEQISAAKKMANNIITNLECDSREVALYLSLLTLYDLVILVGYDSLSMVSQEKGKRKEALETILQNIAKVYQLARKEGICTVRFINYLHRKRNITSGKVKNMLHKHPFGGLTRIGTALKRKVLDEWVKVDMKKPVLVITITDGDIDGEKKSVLINVIFDCIKNLQKGGDEDGAHGQYLNSAIRSCARDKLHADSTALGFQFARVGNDEGAKRLLDMLDLDPEIGGYVDCLPMGIEEIEKDKWIVWGNQDSSRVTVETGTKRYKSYQPRSGEAEDEDVQEGKPDLEA